MQRKRRERNNIYEKGRDGTVRIWKGREREIRTGKEDDGKGMQ